ncbi:MAG TPA: IS256 family transposase [Chloroflexota bacterium]
MAKVVALTERTIAERFAEVKDEDGLWGDIGEETRMLAKRILEEGLEEELSMRLGAAPYSRKESRRGYRNGGYNRSISTRWGLLDVFMPRARTRQAPSAVLGRFARREPEVDRLIREAFLKGISTREVGDVLEPILGWAPSAQTVSRITKSLDSQVRRFHWRGLSDEVRYLLLDGVTMTVKRPGGVGKKLVLVAYGIRPDGTRALLDFRLAPAESTAAWEAFLEDLFRRGLEGRNLALIVTDGCPGLASAIEIVYPRAAHQRCWAHKLRNVAAKLPRKHQAACMKGAVKIYLAENSREAAARLKEWVADWRPIAPRAVACLEEDIEDLLAFFACPRADWRAVRTTNAIERSFREVRRRTRPMSCFQNNASCERIIFAVISHLNEHWSRRPPAQSTQLP